MRSNNYPFQDKFISSFVIACFITLVLMVISLELSKSFAAATKWVQHTYQILYSIAQFKANTIEIELDTQTYRIMGDEKRLINRHQTIQSRQQVIEYIKKETQDNPAQQVHLLQLRNVIAERLAIAEEMISIRKAQGPEAAAAFLTTKPLPETRIRAYQLLGDLEKEEHNLLNQRLLEEEQS